MLFRPAFRLAASTLLLALAGHARAQEPATPPDPGPALERGIAWLADAQSPDGSWPCPVGYKMSDRYMGREDPGHVGITGLAGLALMRAGGHDAAVGRAADWLVELGKRNLYGYITADGTRLLEHALALRFLAELHRRDPRSTREDVLWRGTALVVRSQTPGGGWRYQPFPRDADTPSTAIVLEALLAARAAGIPVEDKAIESAREFARRCTRFQNGMVRYRDLPDYDTRMTYGCTAAGLFTRMTEDPADRKDIRVQLGLEYLRDHRTEVGPTQYHFFFCHYYALLALEWGAPERLQQYRHDLCRAILAEQKPTGEWKDDIGPNYATAMACLILQKLR